MKTYDELIRRWDACRGGQLLVDHQHPIKNMFLNINEKGNRELLVPVKKPIKSFQSTEAIGITNYKAGDTYYFAIELLSESLIKEYACLCFELLQSSRDCSTQEEAVIVLFDTFRKWYSLMADVHLGILPLHEIRGLMGEIKYMIDELSSKRHEQELINAWTTHKDASRDFVFDETWDEIKTIQSTSDYVSISSVDQLDHDMDGFLTVYRLDQVRKESEKAYTLNSIIQELQGKLSMSAEAVLNRKLLAKGYTYNDHYEEYLFVFSRKDRYLVNSSFPRISRSDLAPAIKSAKYELFLSEIEEWRLPYGESRNT